MKKILPAAALAALLAAGCMTRNKMWSEPSYSGDKRVYAGDLVRVSTAARDAGTAAGFTIRRDEPLGPGGRQILYSQGLGANTSGRYLRIRLQQEAGGIGVWVYVRSKTDTASAAAGDGAMERDVHARLAGLLGVAAPAAAPPPPSPPPLAGKGRAPFVDKNNKTVTLDRGIYTGNLVVSGNSNQVTGVAPGATILEGDLVIQGNGNTVSQLEVRGRVIFGGNNNRLRSVSRTGKVEDGGNNNTY